MVARKRISYKRFKVLWNRAYIREISKSPHSSPAAVLNKAFSRLTKKYNVRKQKPRNPFYFYKPSNKW
jgi:predicted transcriptional regulator with HTH domain